MSRKDKAIVMFTWRVLHRRLLLRASLHPELVQQEQQKQPHDQPAPPDHHADAQQIPEDGHQAMGVEPVDSRILKTSHRVSVVSGLCPAARGRRKHSLPRRGGDADTPLLFPFVATLAAVRPNTRSVASVSNQTSVSHLHSP